jgi:hypothetical protein
MCVANVGEILPCSLFSCALELIDSDCWGVFLVVPLGDSGCFGYLCLD